MKTFGFILAAALAAIFFPIYIHQLHKTNEAETAAVSLRLQVTELEGRVAEQESRAEALQTRLHTTRERAVAKADQVVELQQALTNTAATNAKAASPMAEMFKSPEMKNLIKNQQEMVLNSLIDKNYVTFFSSLSPGQAASVKDLLTKRALVDAQIGMSLMGGDVDSSKRNELLQQAKTEKDGINDQIKQLLGDESYAEFKTYEKTVPQRMALNMFKDQQASGPGALTPDQDTQLLQAVNEETLKFKFSTDYSDQAKMSADPSSFFAEDKMAKFQEEREQLHELYRERATNILSEMQIGPFAKFLNTQRDMQDMGLKMAAKLFGGKQ
jgi:hypothetical protein